MDDSKLKEIYDAGERLCSLAREMGYKPDSESDEESSNSAKGGMDDGYEPSSKSSSDLAYNFMNK